MYARISLICLIAGMLGGCGDKCPRELQYTKCPHGEFCRIDEMNCRVETLSTYQIASSTVYGGNCARDTIHKKSTEIYLCKGLRDETGVDLPICPKGVFDDRK